MTNAPYQQTCPPTANVCGCRQATSRSGELRSIICMDHAPTRPLRDYERILCDCRRAWLYRPGMCRECRDEDADAYRGGVA